jgi:hypothetical protein
MYSLFIRIPKCKWQPVVAPFVGLPFASLYGLFATSYTFLGPTLAISCPLLTLSPYRN